MADNGSKGASEAVMRISKMIFDMEHELRYPMLHPSDEPLYTRINKWFETLSKEALTLQFVEVRNVSLKNRIFIYTSGISLISGYIVTIGTDIDNNPLAMRILNHMLNLRFFAEYDRSNPLELEEVCRHFKELVDDTAFFKNPTVKPYRPRDFILNITSDPFIQKTIEVMSLYTAY